MKNYTFHSGNYKPVAQFLFNTLDHLSLQSKEGWKCYYILDNKKDCIAFIWLNIAAPKASSPLKAPFGSFEFKQGLDAAILFDFINYILQDLKNKGISKLSIKQSVDAYAPASNALINTLLLNLGFTIVNAEVANLLRVNAIQYDTQLHAWEKRKLKQARQEQYHFEVFKKNKLNEVYAFIENCRAKKKYILSMSLKELKKLQQTIPDAIHLFGVKHNKEIVAACIAVKVSPTILYTFYYDHSSTYQKNSPVVMLIEGIYNFCLQNKIEILDLGTAALQGKPNFSLLTFKQHLGASYSTKFTFEKNLDD